MSQVDIFVFMDDFQYTKRSYINRNRIKTPEGWMWLTVPVKLDGLPPINEVKIANEKFKNKHLKTLQHMYGNSEHFETYNSWIVQKYEQDWDFLVDLNLSLLEDIVEFFDLEIELAYTSKMEIPSETTTGRIIDICQNVEATHYLSGETGNEYLNKEIFEQSDIDLSFHSFNAFEYPQQFDDFEENLSILDYLMNVGSEFWRK